MTWTWQDVDGIALDLAERYPGVDPVTFSRDELKMRVLALPAFQDDPDAVSSETLEAIQAAWYDEFQDRA